MGNALKEDDESTHYPLKQANDSHGLDSIYRVHPTVSSRRHTGVAVTVTGLTMIGLLLKPRGCTLGAISWVSLALMAIDMLTTSPLFLHGN